MNVTIVAVAALGGVGLLLALLLYVVSRKFQVQEDPRLPEVEEALPGANCGGCGYAGCRQFAEACLEGSRWDALNCPVGGAPVMQAISKILGREPALSDRRIAVLLCEGTCSNRPKTSSYDGASSCAVAALTFGGESACSWGCLGLADCVDVCRFDALVMDPLTGLPVVDEQACTACGACVKACPKSLFELRKQGPDSRRIYVACRNKDKGALARKACKVACIGCSKCESVCPSGAIRMGDNLAYIDDEACTLCRACVNVCPTHSILETNFN